MKSLTTAGDGTTAPTGASRVAVVAAAADELMNGRDVSRFSPSYS